MNDMNETLAEIRRRGDARIRARKRMQKRITALCVPLVLCVAAALAMPEFAHPTYMSKSVETMIPAIIQSTKESFSGVGAMTHEMPPVLLTVTGNGFSRSYTDMETLVQLQELLDSWMVMGQGSVHATDRTASGTPFKITENLDGFRLTVCDEEEPREYVLYSNAIYDEEENLCYGISTAQYNALLRLLELP